MKSESGDSELATILALGGRATYLKWEETMQRPRREEFILDVRRTAKTLQKPKVDADSDALETDVIANILYRAALWLTPKVVEHYQAKDFTGRPKEQQNRLRLAVKEFREIADQVPPNKPATIDQFRDGVNRFRNLNNVLGEIVRDEWISEIETIEKQVEEWSKDVGWRSRRIIKTMGESLVGPYEAPQLLIFAEPNLYVLDPVARFIPQGIGSFDFAIQPSYHMTSLYRDFRGVWYVYLDVRNGVSKGRREKWSRDSFHKCIDELRVFV